MSETVVSIIIPCWKEDLGKTLDLVQQLPCPNGVEWIVAMANPPSDWKEMVAEIKKCNFTLVECKETGRGNQMNEGAAVANGEMLIFHHCDTDLEETHLLALIEANEQQVKAGAFQRILDDRHKWLKRLNPIVRWYNQRWGILFGDQSFFIQKDFFQEIGGFKSIKLMEDVEMSARVRKLTEVKLLDPPILTSERRSSYFGSWKVTLINLWLLTLFKLGVSTDKLHDMYYKNWKIK